MTPDRVFTTLVFLALATLDAWEDTHGTELVSIASVGLLSVAVWVLTLAGALGYHRHAATALRARRKERPRVPPTGRPG